MDNLLPTQDGGKKKSKIKKKVPKKKAVPKNMSGGISVGLSKMLANGLYPREAPLPPPSLLSQARSGIGSLGQNAYATGQNAYTTGQNAYTSSLPYINNATQSVGEAGKNVYDRGYNATKNLGAMADSQRQFVPGMDNSAVLAYGVAVGAAVVAGRLGTTGIVNLSYIVSDKFRPFMKNLDFSVYIEEQVNLLNSDISAKSIKITKSSVKIINDVMLKTCAKMMKEIHGFNSGVVKMINPFLRRELTNESFNHIITKMFTPAFCAYLRTRVAMNILSMNTETTPEGRAEKNRFSVMTEVSLLINENARIGFTLTNSEGFIRPEPNAVESFSSMIFIVMDEIINGSLSFLEGDALSSESVNQGLYHNLELNKSLEMMKISTKKPPDVKNLLSQNSYDTPVKKTAKKAKAKKTSKKTATKKTATKKKTTKKKTTD
jgi:hypothetical protein